MKKLTKLTSLVLCAGLIVTSLAACGKKETNGDSGEKLTYWLQMSTEASETLSSYNDLLMYQEINKATGIDVEFISPAQGSTGEEAFQILLASGNYPDMIEYSWKRYPGGPDQAIDDGVIISLNDYLQEYAPNYYNYMEGEKGKENNYLYKAQALSNKGNYFGFSNLAIGSYRGFGGIYIRKDLLDEWGLDVPVTIDDWTNVLKTAKANGIKAPITGTANLFQFNTTVQSFNTAWNVSKNFFIDDGTVKFGPFEDSYKEYVKTMAEWMKAGYIDPDYITNDSTNVEGAMTNGTSIAAFGYVGSGIGKLLPAMAEKDPNYSVVACPYPVFKEGDVPMFQEVSPEVTDNTIAITVQCGKDDESKYKDAVKWCDYLYSEEGMKLKSFGVEGNTYTTEEREDGTHYVYTDKIFDHEKYGMHSVQAALYHYMRPANAPGLNQHPDYLNGYYPYAQQKEAIEIWNKHVDVAKQHVLPTLSYTSEESTKIAQIEAKARDTLESSISNIILGRASIDTYDEAVEKAKESGYGEYLKIQQDAYNRYLKFIK